MKILIRDSAREEWEKLESFEYSQETELQELLAESPELIDITDIREGASSLLVAVREFGLPGSGHTDIVAFSASGDIAVVECKLAANTEIKRKVVGQALEYGAYLWKTSYERLDRVVKERNGKSLVELIRERVDDPEWDEEKFRSTIRLRLNSGDFILVIAVDEMNEELSRTIRYLNDCGNPAFAFTALGIQRFQSGDSEILVPHLFGVVTAKPPVEPKKKWDEASFFNEILNRKGELAASVARDIYEWAKPKLTRIWWGEGTRTGSFVPVYHHKGVDHQLFAVYTYGRVEIYFYWYTYKPPFNDEKKRLELLKRLNAIDGVNIPEEAIAKRPSIVLSNLDTNDKIEQFIQAFDWYLEVIRES